MKTGKFKICVVTGSRAEYGLLMPLMQMIRKENKLELQLLVTGMHLSPEFGLSYKQIENDGFVINEKVEMILSADTDTAIIKSTGVGMIGYADALQRLGPDWIVVLGDRFESFAAVVAAFLSKIPVAHLHGGELTEGATDDALRHAISKMSYLHFTSTPEYRQRVIQLGEDPSRVFHVGAIGIDNIKSLKLLSRKELEKQLVLSLDGSTILVTYHPVTHEKNTAEQHIQNLLQAIERFPHLKIIFTLPNADANGRIIKQAIEAYVKLNSEKAKVFVNLGQVRYLSLLKYVVAAVGNSSSGIIEVPSFGIPTVNIGSRQAGRVRSSSVIDTDVNVDSIVKGMKKALSPAFAEKSRSVKNVYGEGNTAANILKQIKKVGKLNSIQKSFYDLI